MSLVFFGPLSLVVYLLLSFNYLPKPNVSRCLTVVCVWRLGITAPNFSACRSPNLCLAILAQKNIKKNARPWRRWIPFVNLLFVWICMNGQNVSISYKLQLGCKYGTSLGICGCCQVRVVNYYDAYSWHLSKWTKLWRSVPRALEKNVEEYGTWVELAEMVWGFFWQFFFYIKSRLNLINLDAATLVSMKAEIKGRVSVRKVMLVFYI